MNVLFVCTRNRWRSLTAEHIFKNKPGLVARSAGTASSARRKITKQDIMWADKIFVMEKKHEEILQHTFPTEIKKKEVICLHIPDEYQYMDSELIENLTTTVEQIIQPASRIQ